MQEEKPQVAPEDDMDLAQDMNTLVAKMRKVLGLMSENGEVDPEEAHLANEALFFLKCWEEASGHADSQEVLGMNPVALKAASLFVATQSHDMFEGKTEMAMGMFLMGVFTGIEYQERKHA